MVSIQRVSNYKRGREKKAKYISKMKFLQDILLAFSFYFMISENTILLVVKVLLNICRKKYCHKLCFKETIKRITSSMFPVLIYGFPSTFSKLT